MDKLFLGINSHVVCISKSDGSERWKAKLKLATITNVYYENDQVFAYAGVHLFCLSASDGAIIWENPLKGMGYGTCIIASEHQAHAVIANQVAAEQQANSAAIIAVGGTSASDGDGC